ncbi:hypothetical protein [Streptomyces sp. NPDC090025]|uniref:hypothetical protein n=1 Tax=Streptomyces sp. NPDC090025 TaxID=3365922 RepID=UPI0038327095
MLTYENVTQASLAKLKTAVDHWAEMKTRLDRLAEDARTTMAAKAKDDDWRGMNAEVTKPFVDKAAKEFADAAKAADGISRVLQEGYAAFHKAQGDLRGLAEEAPRQGLVIRSDGVVEAAHPLATTSDPAVRNDPDFRDLINRQNQAIGSMRKRIDAVLETCDDADEACANALRADAGPSRHDFSAPRYNSLDEEEADRALALARKGRDLTHAELARLNELLGDNNGSAVFSRTFYDGLGPKGALEFFGQLSADTYEYGKPDEQRLTDVRDLQKNLGLTLAGATRSDDAWADRWSTALRGLGAERLPMAKNDYNPPYGYQLLGGLLRYGDYNPKFLVPIAEHVTQLHAKDPQMFATNKGYGGPRQNLFNPSGTNGAGYDPVVPVLEALGHSPEAAKEFFSKRATSYETNGTVGGDFTLGTNGERAPKTYLSIFTDEKYAQFPDIDRHTPDEVTKSKDFLPDALGHALEAATLGHAWDDPEPKLLRDATTSRIMEEVVQRYGDAKFLKEHHSVLSDSLGTMAAGYIDDLNRSLADGPVATNAFAWRGEMADSTAHATFRNQDATAFLSTLAQHPDSYATLSVAEPLYVTSVMEREVREHDGAPLPVARIGEIASTGATVQGLLDRARVGQIEAEAVKVQEDYAKAQEARGAWIEFGAGAAVGVGAALLPATAVAAGAAAIVVPLAVDTGSSALETVAGQLVGDWSDKSVDDHKGDLEQQTKEATTSVYGQGRRRAFLPLDQFIMEHQSQLNDDQLSDLNQIRKNSYDSGGQDQVRRGTLPQAGDGGPE